MIGLLTTDTSLDLFPKLDVRFTGGRDEMLAGPKWGWRTQYLGLTYRISAIPGTGRRIAAVGTLNLRRPLRRAIGRLHPPPEITTTIKQSPICHLGITSRTLSVTFSQTAPWKQPLPNGRQLWDAMPLSISGLERIIAKVAQQALFHP